MEDAKLKSEKLSEIGAFSTKPSKIVNRIRRYKYIFIPYDFLFLILFDKESSQNLSSSLKKALLEKYNHQFTLRFKI